MKHVWGPDLHLFRQLRGRRGRLSVPAHHTCPPHPADARGLRPWAARAQSRARWRPRPLGPMERLSFTFSWTEMLSQARGPSLPLSAPWAALGYQVSRVRPGSRGSCCGSGPPAPVWGPQPARPPLPPSFILCGPGMSSSGLGGPPTEDTLRFLSRVDQDTRGPGLGYSPDGKTRTDLQGPRGPAMSSASCL